MPTSTCGGLGDPATLAPLDGVTESQPDPPESVCADAVHAMLPCAMFWTPKLWPGVELPPATAVNVSPLCSSRMVWRIAPTVMVTGIAFVSPVVGLETVIAPEYVPG